MEGYLTWVVNTQYNIQMMCYRIIHLIYSARWVGMQIGAATVETVWNFLKKLKMELSFDPDIPLLGLYPKNPETPIQ